MAAPAARASPGRLLLAALGPLARTASGHGYLADPPSRNLVAFSLGGESCPHCLQANGPAVVSERGRLTWPSKDAPESHGLCGDPVQGSNVTNDWRDEPYLVPTEVQRTYTAGDEVEFTVKITTHHKGHFEFRICDQAIDGQTLSSRRKGQECLDAHVLERVPPRASCRPNDPDHYGDCQPIDELHPGRWHLPPPNGSKVAAKGGITEAEPLQQIDGETRKMRFKIPDDLSCERCTLQWYWSTGNNCFYDGDYPAHFKSMKRLGWRAEEWCPWCLEEWATCENACCGKRESHGQPVFGEEFWNCADIAILPKPGAAGAVDELTALGDGRAPSLAWREAGGATGAAELVAPSTSSTPSPARYEVSAAAGEAEFATPSTSGAPSLAWQEAPAAATPGAPAGSRGAEGGADGGGCSCAASTSWDGDFARFAKGQSFCEQGFGGASPYVSSGGGDGSDGGESGLGPCKSGQYSFSEHGWRIAVDAADAAGKAPYRAFAYLQLCNGRPYGECWSDETVSLSFAFKTEGLGELAAFVKLLFWTDSGNILGLLPPGHPKGEGRLRLVTFMEDDYPNAWSNEATLQEDAWHHCRIDFTPAYSLAAVFLDGEKLDEGTLPVDMLEASSGPQLGVYSFDFGGGGWPRGFDLWLNGACVGESSCAASAGGAGPRPRPPAPAPLQQHHHRQRLLPVPLPVVRSTALATHRPRPAPLRQQPRCAEVFDQCGGGSDWTGPTCCSDGYECRRLNLQYSQCVPDGFLAAGGPQLARKFADGAAAAPAVATAAAAAALSAAAVLVVAAALLWRRRPRYEHLVPQVGSPPSGTATESQA